MKELTLPLSKSAAAELRAGDSVSLTGVILTARDCAHKRIFKILEEGKPLPFDLKNAVIYYAGPCPAKAGRVWGCCGPTISVCLVCFAPAVLDCGLGAIIGKGEMNDAVRDALKRNGAVYFAAVGGAGALYGSAIKSSQCIAFEDLLSEAVYRLEVENFPVIVAYDAVGGSIY